MKKFLYYLLFAGWLCFLQFLTLAAQAQSPVPVTSPPFVFTATGVIEARDQAKRAGWSEGVIDSQMKTALDAPARCAWVGAVKAAFFGGEERMRQSSAALKDALHSLREKKLLAGGAENGVSLSDIHLLLQTYDVLTAIPEWEKLGEADRSSLRGSLVDFIQTLLTGSPDNLSSLSAIHIQSARLYAGVLFGATGFVQKSLAGESYLPSLAESLRTGLTGEGLFQNASFESHTQISLDLLKAGAALKTASPDGFQNHSLAIEKPLKIAAELAYPAGETPQMIAPAKPQDLAALFELGYRVFGSPDYAVLLQKIYRSQPRSGEALLLGKLNLEEALPTARVSTALPQTGAAILNNNLADKPLSVYFDTGLYSRQEKKSAMLALEIRTELGSLNSFEKKADSDGFNSVVIDRAPQPPYEPSPNAPQNALISSFHCFGENGSFVNAMAAGGYSDRPAYPNLGPAAFYQRTLYLADPFLIDLFRVRGGRVHDYAYYSAGDIREVSGAPPIQFPSTASDLTAIRNAAARGQVFSAQGVYSVLFKPKDLDQASERLWFVDPAGSQLLTGPATGGAFAITRRESGGDEADLFAAVHEIFRTALLPETRVVRLPLSPPANQRDFQAAAFAVESEHRSDIFLSTIQGDQEYTAEYHGGRIVFNGLFGHIRLKDGQFESLRLIGGTRLRYDVHGVDLKNPAEIGVVDNGDYKQGTIKVSFPHPLPSGTAMRSHSFLALHPEGGPVQHQPLMIDEILEKAIPQTIRLQHDPNLIDPSPTLGAPLKTGDQILLENFAELIYKGNDAYSLTYTAPAQITVPTTPKCNRVVVFSSLLTGRIRGEKTAGVIMFNADPIESVNGKVDFSLMK
ncbi:MAG: hypothetical protein AB1656_16185 [Candidatus Omnitrophota bacterium]